MGDTSIARQKRMATCSNHWAPANYLIKSNGQRWHRRQAWLDISSISVFSGWDMDKKFNQYHAAISFITAQDRTSSERLQLNCPILWTRMDTSSSPLSRQMHLMTMQSLLLIVCCLYRGAINRWWALIGSGIVCGDEKLKLPVGSQERGDFLHSQFVAINWSIAEHFYSSSYHFQCRELMRY